MVTPSRPLNNWPTHILLLLTEKNWFKRMNSEARTEVFRELEWRNALDKCRSCV